MSFKACLHLLSFLVWTQKKTTSVVFSALDQMTQLTEIFLRVALSVSLISLTTDGNSFCGYTKH